ncbi:MAG: hypothetical protein ABIV93_31920 [Byssovorax sp.]
MNKTGFKRLIGKTAVIAGIAGSLVGCDPDSSVEMDAKELRDIGTSEQAVYQGPNPKLMFRYQAENESLTAGNGASGGDIKGTVGPLVTVSRGGTYFNPVYYRFFQAGVFQAVATAPVQSGTGFTITAQFRASPSMLTTGAVSKIYSDAEAGGVALGLTDGKLKLQWHDGTGYQSITDTAVIDQSWHMVVAAVTVNAATPDSSYARIWVDGVLRMNVNPMPGAQNIKNSNQVPCVGAECNGAGAARAPSGEYFDGFIANVEMLNYPLWSYVYRGNLLNDGGRYGGFPDYFDYTPTTTDTADGTYRSKWRAMGDGLNETGALPEFEDMGAKVTERLVLPYLNDKFVYQGIYVGQTSVANDTMWIAGHHQADATAPEAWMIVSDIDLTGVVGGSTTNPKIRRTYRLVDSAGVPLNGHTSSVVKVGNYLWVSSTTYGLSRFNLTTARTTFHAADTSWQRPAIEDLVRTNVYSNCGGASISYDAKNNALWCFWDGARTIKKLNLNADGTLMDTTYDATYGESPALPTAPFDSYTLQGGSPYYSASNTTNTPCFLMHYSNGSNGPSHLYRWCPGATSMTELSGKLATGGEGVNVTSNGMIWGIVEGASYKIQKDGARSSAVQPWIWGIPRSTFGI